MNGIWACWCWPVVASRAWLDFWFGPHAGAAAPATVADDELPCTDHDLFA